MVIMNNVNTTERLIQEVRSRPPLWDQRNINYHNRVVVNALWQDIADLLQVNKETVKVKWKGLRDTYRRELKKQRSSATGQNGLGCGSGENARDPSWTHYSSMNFLREYMGSNNNSGNQNDLFPFQGWPTDDMVVDGEANSPTATPNEAFSPYAPPPPPPLPPPSNDEAPAIDNHATGSPTPSPLSGDEWATNVKTEPRRDHDELSPASPAPSPPTPASQDAPRKRSSVARLSRLKEHCRFRSTRLSKGVKQTTSVTKSHRSLVYQNGTTTTTSSLLPSAVAAADDSDDDLYFFKSLVPYVRSLPPTRKLYLRSEIHNLVLREMMAADSAANNGSHQHGGVIPLEHVSVGFNA